MQHYGGRSNYDDLRKEGRYVCNRRRDVQAGGKAEDKAMSKEEQRWNQNIFPHPYHDFLTVVTGIVEIESLIRFLYSPLQENGIHLSLAAPKFSLKLCPSRMVGQGIRENKQSKNN
jgi:hypothetical protein